MRGRGPTTNRPTFREEPLHQGQVHDGSSLFCVQESEMITNNDLTTRAIEWAMDGLEKRTSVIANNIANSEVPNFRASKVSFESQLRTALDTGRTDRQVNASIESIGNAPNPNGNDVVIEDELVSMIETNLRKNAMVQAFNYKAGLLRAAIGGR
jgi:flagellar basal-body rod protein FlgB